MKKSFFERFSGFALRGNGKHSVFASLIIILTNSIISMPTIDFSEISRLVFNVEAATVILLMILVRNPRKIKVFFNWLIIHTEKLNLES
ncbi:hypothetical protein [Chryseobacterium indoltheticum]|uniref:Uncharacterized protein n=1 Tax=Chryseobacterium indoltheticum TaxID=254 RepID=A0A381FD27_9FLAO|nr:hypothetical protein [Chryseobacterium indoltheticum]SUX43992.1 Uncharacterised protein [Chryseobacterium indoltheticum]